MLRSRFSSSAGFLHPSGKPGLAFCFRARHSSSLAPSAAAKAAALLDANPANPLGVFWRALHDKTLKGPGVALGVAMDARCGLGREATEQDVRNFPSMLRCINPGDTPWTLAALADRTDVLIELIGADKGTLLPSESEALPAAANEGPIRSGPCAVAKMGFTPLHVSVCKSGSTEVRALGCKVGFKEGFDRTALHLAAIKGDVGMVSALVGMGASNTDYDARGFTPLHYAAEMGHLDILQQLTTTESAAAQDMAGRTALYVACERGDVAVVQELVKLSGLSGDLTAVGGRRAIHVAAESGNMELVNVLLDIKVQLANSAAKEEFINSRDAEGNTPLMHAARNGYREVFELLVQRGADAKAKNTSGWTPLKMAAANGWTSTVDIISNKTFKCVSYTKAYGMAQMKLRGSSESGLKELTDYFWIALNDQSVDAGFIAAIVEDPLFGLNRLVNNPRELFLENRMLGSEQSTRATPLMLAALTNRVDVMEALLIAGADPLKGHYLSPTEIAAMIGSVEAIKLLHSYGGKQEYQTPTSDYYKRHYYDYDLEDCRPVLQRATFCGHVECVKVLLDYGASLTCCSERFGKPLICAVRTGKTSILALMVAALPKGSKSIDEALQAAAIEGQLDCVKLLLAEGTDKELLNCGADHHFFNDVTEENDPYEVISVLLDNNGDDSAGTYFDHLKNIGTPLHFAAVRGDHAFMEFLLSNGAKPNEVNSVRKTALHCCAVSCIELLVANGAEINATDNNGWTALHFAVKYGKEDCIAKLIALGADQTPAPAKEQSS